jgi:hypothetical protein
MASTFKPIGSGDVVSTRTLLHEAIPITGTIIHGTYDDENIKNYSHGMFQSVYDYPYLSSSANHIFDITLGYGRNSASSGSVISSAQPAKKENLYNQMAQLLVGYDITGAIRPFDEDGDLTKGTKIEDAMFISFARLLVKDEIKKGTFSLTLGVGGAYATPFTKTTSITDRNAATSFKVNSPVGEYGILYATGNLVDPSAAGYLPCGLLFYQAGIAVLSSSILQSNHSSDSGLINEASMIGFFDAATSFTGTMEAHEISGAADSLRRRVNNLSFNNTTELNSTIYFCRANHNEFNFSANPTYLSASQIRVKNQSSDSPVSYITTVGLYSADNQLLAVGKLSEPLRKDPSMEYTLRARIDY